MTFYHLVPSKSWKTTQFYIFYIENIECTHNSYRFIICTSNRHLIVSFLIPCTLLFMHKATVNNGLEHIRHHCYTAYSTPIFFFLNTFNQKSTLSFIIHIARIIYVIIICVCYFCKSKSSRQKFHIEHLELRVFCMVCIEHWIQPWKQSFTHLY